MTKSITFVGMAVHKASINVEVFSLNASVKIHENDRKGRERLCLTSLEVPSRCRG